MAHDVELTLARIEKALRNFCQARISPQVKQRVDGEDLLQLVLIKAFEKLTSGELNDLDEKQVIYWAYKQASNIAGNLRSHHLAKCRNVMRDSSAYVNYQVRDEATAEWQLESDEKTPAEIAIDREAVEAIRADVVHVLDRRVIDCVMAGMSIADIASELAVPVTRIYQRLKALRARVKKLAVAA